MKKRFWLLLFCCLLLSGCGGNSEKGLLKKLTNNIKNASSYYAEGTMELINNEDVYTYDVKVSYKEKDNYKVELTNISNNHEQIILRNNDGVYVITPSLNKSFKFQSDWPYNNSQIYLLDSIVDDLKDDEKRTFEKKDNNYIYTSSVNYPNNKKLQKQIVTVNNKNNIAKVEVVDKNNNKEITMTFNKIDLKPKFKDNYFELNELIDTKIEQKNTEEETKETVTLDDVIYPMYLPTNTYLTNQEAIDTDNGKRLILTFDGDKPFILIEETVNTSSSHEVIPTFGDIEFLADSIAVVSDNSVNWYSNGIEYYAVSNTLEISELLQVAKSISVIPVASLK